MGIKTLNFVRSSFVVVIFFLFGITEKKPFARRAYFNRASMAAVMRSNISSMLPVPLTGKNEPSPM